MFFIIGILILKRLNKYFNKFYSQYKAILIFATLGLSVPLMVRGMLDTLRILNEDIRTYLEKHECTFLLISVIFLNTLPMGL